MPDLFDTGWLPIFMVAGVILAGMVLKRRQDLKWIKTRFESERVIITGFGTHYFGRESDQGPIRANKGALLLTTGRLFFGRTRNKQELDIPGDRIMRVTHGVCHRNKDLKHSVIKIDFLNADDQVDTVAFKVPYPPQWIKAIGMAFGLRRTDTASKTNGQTANADHGRTSGVDKIPEHSPDMTKDDISI